MDPALRERKQRELDSLQSQVASLQAELDYDRSGDQSWRGPDHYYATYYATAGFFLGMLGAVMSLLVNVVGALLFQKPSAVYLIQVYLTFNLGAKALEPEFSNSVALAIGCCLYIATGMMIGIPFHLILTYYTPNYTFWQRFAVGSALSIAIWLVMYYGVLSWLQPMLLAWVSPNTAGPHDPEYLAQHIQPFILQKVEWYVAAVTHLVYGWTMVIVYPLGLYEPYRLQTEQ